jgi:selenide,water dikinase
MTSPEIIQEAVTWMMALNREAALLMVECNASAATDVTGFGLLGHACEMARGAAVTFRLEVASVPVMSGVAGLVSDGMVPAGCYRNRDHYQPFVNSSALNNEAALLPLFDPQTSGGLMISLSPEDAERFMSEASDKGIYAQRIGSVIHSESHLIEIV